MRLLRSSALAFLLGAACGPALMAPALAQDFAITVQLVPPPLPVYVQPAIPGPDYIWTPGYWAYEPEDGYFWVPGTWVLAPRRGLLWTPGYWSYDGGRYGYRQGYWGDHVGYYGGVSYGYGYTGDGYAGGYWEGDRFFYNRSVNNITNVTNITNVYNKTVVTNQTSTSNASFNGAGGTTAQPTPQQKTFAASPHVAQTPVQTEHITKASHEVSLRATENHGRPLIAATQKAAEFKGPGIVAAKAAGPVTPATAIKPNEAGKTPAATNALPGQPSGKPLPKTSTAPSDTPLKTPKTAGGPANAAVTPRKAEEVKSEAAKPGLKPGTSAHPAELKNAPSHMQAEPKAKAHTATPQAEKPREQHAAPQPRPEAQKAEPRPQAQPHPAQPHAEQARPQAQSHPAQPHMEQARPQPHPEAHAAPKPAGGKPEEHQKP